VAGSTVSAVPTPRDVTSRQMSAAGAGSPRTADTITALLASRDAANRQSPLASPQIADAVTVRHLSQDVTSCQLSSASSPQTADAVTARLPSHSPPSADGNHLRLLNSSNVRMPLGRPPSPPQTSVTSVDVSDADTCDTNPLRRLRNVGTFRPVTTSYVQRFK